LAVYTPVDFGKDQVLSLEAFTRFTRSDAKSRCWVRARTSQSGSDFDRKRCRFAATTARGAGSVRQVKDGDPLAGNSKSKSGISAGVPAEIPSGRALDGASAKECRLPLLRDPIAHNQQGKIVGLRCPAGKLLYRAQDYLLHRFNRHAILAGQGVRET
jgi:hypothetical protein